MLTINTNLSSLITQRSMKTSTNKLNQAIERMTTGFKINHAKDNAANYSITTNLTTKIGSYNVAEDNCAMGLDLISTAEGSLDQIQDKLQRIRDLQEQASNGTYGEQSLLAINAEVNALVDEINQVYSTTEYNGLRLFGSETTSVPVALVDNSEPIQTFALGRSVTVESDFTANPISYTDEQIVKLTTLTDFFNGVLSPTNEYSISSVEELVALADYVNGGNNSNGMTFVLGEDIDLSGIDNWTPIGNDLNQFAGKFDGNGHIIKNLTVSNESDYQGFFGYTSTGSEIKNLGIVGGDVFGCSYIGGLVGYSNSVINNCFVEIDYVMGDGIVGGLVGVSQNSITNSYATCDIMGVIYDSIGGLVGESYASITNCFATGNIEVLGCENVGGLVGMSAGSITNCFATGSSNGSGGDAGGLVGQSTGIISNCYATGDVSADTAAGGLVGNSSNTITNCYATGNVGCGYSAAGGLVGTASGSITNCFATGDSVAIDNLGGLAAGCSSCVITNCYALGATDGRTGNAEGGLIGKVGSGTVVNNCASVQTDSEATQMTEAEIIALYTPESMGFVTDNGWTVIENTPKLLFEQQSFKPNDSSLRDLLKNLIDNSEDSFDVGLITLHVGLASDSASQINVNTHFTITNVDDLRMIGLDLMTDYLSQIDDMLAVVSDKQTHFGAVSNRLESVLEEIIISRDNLISSRSTLQDADIAEVSSEYIRQQILQQASATLMATANQSPAIALQLI